MDIKQRAYKIFSQIMGLPLDKINDESSPDTVPEWDSIEHMNLVLALEEEFGISFTEQMIIEMLNVGLIIDSIETILKNE